MLATVASINAANRLKKYISDEHPGNIRIIQTPSSLTKEGCGYSLKFDDSLKPAVAKAAAKLKISIRAFFRENASSDSVIYEKV